jgi:hypothetical protein
LKGWYQKIILTGISETIKYIQVEMEILFENIDILLDTINEFDSTRGGFTTWRHFYHLIHSIDKYLFDPDKYIEPLFHKKDLSVIYLFDNNKLTKNEIIGYYNDVKNRILNYVNDLNESILKNDLTEHKFHEILVHILGQIRHSYYHIGYLHCCMKIEKGETPEWINLQKHYEIKSKNK